MRHNSRRSSQQSGMELHLVIRDYKLSEEEKINLRNRINIMNTKQNQNHEKIRSIQKQLQRYNSIRAKQKQERENNMKATMRELNQTQMKKKQNIRKIKEEKQKIQFSKRYYADFKAHLHKKVRSQSQINSERISINRQKQQEEKRRKKEEISAAQELGKSKVDKFRTTKLLNVKSQQSSKVLQQIDLNNSTQTQLKALRKLEEQLMIRLSASVTSLQSSRTVLRKLKPLRV